MEQTYKNLEIICINDCSSDNTGKILQCLATEDSRIVYVENKINLKLPKTLNKGITLAKGEYIARMDADDIAFPERIEKQLYFLKQNPEVDVLGSNVQIINEQGILENRRSFVSLEHENITKQLTWKTGFMHPTILAKKSFFTDLNGYQNISYGEDYEMWIRGWLSGKKYANLKEVLLYYRSHEQQMSGISFSKKNSRSVQNFLLEYFGQTKNIWFFDSN